MIENLTKKNLNIIQNSFINIENIKKELKTNPYAKILIYKENNEIIAYLYYSIIYERTEINMLEVRIDKRNQKIASKLLQKYLEETNKPSTLEVNVNNKIAIKLYEKFGYKKVAIRKQYYQNEDSLEDGLLMERK